MIPGPESTATEFLQQKNQMITKLKENLAQAQAIIKKFADKNRLERKFEVGDMVYLKLHPYIHYALNLHSNLKLSTKYFGPFRITESIGPAAYRLQLPDNTEIHPVFHVSQLKKHVGPKAVPQANLPMVTLDGYIKLAPVIVLETRALPQQDHIITQWLVQWPNLNTNHATWEDKSFIKDTFPQFYQQTLQEWWPDGVPCGQEHSQGRGEGELSDPGDQEF
jgi:hypothetical protein